MGSKNKKNNNNNSNPNTDHDGGADGARRGGNRHGNQKVITDPRFASVHSDPRFMNPPKRKSKVTIDSRFDRMFKDKSFSSSAAPVDKRGKSKKDSESSNPLKHYYHLDEEIEDKRRVDVDGEDKEESNQSESESDDAKLKTGRTEESSDSELQTESEPSEEEQEVGDDDDDLDTNTSSTGSDSDYDVFSDQEETLAQEENVPEIDKETHRLAVVNMDWNQVKAVDLLVLLSSFLPKGGQILSVSVYPSEFGLKQMAEEAVHGPVGLFDDDKERNADDDDNDDEIDMEKLRAYELSRLRYYYAVVECDSVATADYLYKCCDGVEFERSSNKLDLRFIPDSMEFKLAPRDVAAETPGSYEGIDFQTRALQQSKVNLTWDEDEPQRSRTLKRKFNADQLAELELKEFLASDGSGTDDGENDDNVEDISVKKHKKQDLYRALIQSGDVSDGDEEKDFQEMEVTFNTGLEDISKRILEKKDKKSETVWEAYLRNRREKKKARKNRSKDSSEDEGSETDREPTEEPDDFFVEEPRVKKTKKSVRQGKEPQETAEVAEASTAELELLLADENGDTNLKGYNLKPKKSKGKRLKEISDDGKIPTIDSAEADPRFSSKLNTPLFALDPTDPQFKRSAKYAWQVAQKNQKVGRRGTGRDEHTIHGETHLSGDVEKSKDEHILSHDLQTKRDKHELSSLVKSIKMKSRQLPAKISRKKGTNTIN